MPRTTYSARPRNEKFGRIFHLVAHFPGKTPQILPRNEKVALFFHFGDTANGPSSASEGQKATAGRDEGRGKGAPGGPKYGTWCTFSCVFVPGGPKNGTWRTPMQKCGSP